MCGCVCIVQSLFTEVHAISLVLIGWYDFIVICANLVHRPVHHVALSLSLSRSLSSLSLFPHPLSLSLPVSPSLSLSFPFPPPSTVDEDDTVLVPRHLLVFLNPVSGSGKTVSDFRQHIQPLFDLAEINYHLIVTGTQIHNMCFIIMLNCL